MAAPRSLPVLRARTTEAARPAWLGHTQHQGLMTTPVLVLVLPVLVAGAGVGVERVGMVPGVIRTTAGSLSALSRSYL